MFYLIEFVITCSWKNEACSRFSRSLQVCDLNPTPCPPAAWRTRTLSSSSSPHLHTAHTTGGGINVCTTPTSYSTPHLCLVANLFLASAEHFLLRLTPRCPPSWTVLDSHWMNQALQMALFRRILSLHSNRRPLKDFHLGENIFALQTKHTINQKTRNLYKWEKADVRCTVTEGQTLFYSKVENIH